MKKLPSEYFGEFEYKLRKIYMSQTDEFKKSVSEIDFTTAFPVVFINGNPTSLEKPDNFEIPDETYFHVQEAYDLVYKPIG